MHKLDKYYIEEDGILKHKTPLKLFINPILRKLQFWTTRPYVFASITNYVEGVPTFEKYQFMRIRYWKNIEDYNNDISNHNNILKE